MTPRRWLLTAISFLFTIGASVYIIRSSWSEEGARVGLPLWGHVACFTAAFLELLCRSIKIRLSGAALRIPLDLRTALRASLGGDFGAAITPARSGAEPARFLILREEALPVADALVILFLELFLEMLSLAALAAALAFVLGRQSSAVRGLVALVGGYSTLVIGLGALGYTAARRWADGPPPTWLQRLGLSDRRWHAVQLSLRHLRGNVRMMRTARWWVMASSLAFSILHVLMRLTILPIIVFALGARTAIGPLVLWPLAIYYGGAVSPAPAGGGLIEIAFRGALNDHIPAPVLGASLLWWRVYTFYILLIGGAIVTGAVVLRSLKRDGVADMVTG
jgi:glycosyltransferase 2 family protein